MSSEPNPPPASSEAEEPERSGSYVSEKASKDPLVMRTARNVRRVGYVISVTAILICAIPILVGVVRGVINEQALDPYSLRPLPSRSSPRSAADCTSWGVELVRARERGQLASADREAWWTRCGANQPLLPQPDTQLTVLRELLAEPAGE